MTKSFLCAAFAFTASQVLAEADQCAASGAQCGGNGFEGPGSCCDPNEACVFHYEYFSRCEKPSDQCVETFAQCGGRNWQGETSCCDFDAFCYEVNDRFSQCRPLSQKQDNSDCSLVETGVDNVPSKNASGFALRHGPLKVVGTKLVSTLTDEVVLLRGLSTQYLPDMIDCVTAPSLKKIVEHWGVNLIKVAIAAEYMWNETVRAEIDQVVDDALSLGVYVMYTFGNRDPSPWYYETGEGAVNGTLTDFWLEIASKYGNNPYFMFDLVDEPHSGEELDGWEKVKSYLEYTLPKLREAIPDSIILVPTNFWNQHFYVVIADLLCEELSHNILYKFDFYSADHPHYMARLMKYSQYFPMFIHKWGLGTWRRDVLFAEIAQGYIDIFDKYQIGWSFANYDDSVYTDSIFEQGACADQDFERLSCHGVYMKTYFTTGALPDQCSATGTQCGGLGFTGGHHCCSETDTCVEVNETYSECQDLGYVCAASYEQCFGLDENNDFVRKGCCNPQDQCRRIGKGMAQCVPNELACDLEDSDVVLDSASSEGFAVANGLLNIADFRLFNAAGERVQLRGLTLNKECDSTEVIMQYVTEWGANTIRLPVYADGGISTEQLIEVNETIQLCDSLGVYCVISFYLVENGNPLDFVGEALGFWLPLAEQTKNKTNVIFEVVNTAFGTGYDKHDWYNIRGFNDAVVGEILAVNPEATIFLGVGNGFDFYLPHMEHIRSEWKNKLIFSTNFESNDARHVARIESFKEYVNDRMFVVSELKVDDGADEDRVYPLNTRKLVDALNERGVSWITAPRTCNCDLYSSASILKKQLLIE